MLVKKSLSGATPAYTEDDTFLALSRSSVAEMCRHYENWAANSNGRFEGLEAMCLRHGWTWDEFSIAGYYYRESRKASVTL